MRLFYAILALAALAPAVHAQAPVGDWSGGLNIPGAPEPLQFIIHVAMTGDSLGSTLDVPQQGGFGVPATTTTFRNDSLIVTFDPFQARLALAVAPDSLRGTFSQGGNSLPIVMGPAAPLRRPQTPEAPFPYATEDVAVEAAPGVTLTGTFVRPEGAGPFPAVLLLSGSSELDRDAEQAGHRPFAVLADHLARAGVASLRLDGRGESADPTLDDLTADARAALAVLAARPGVSRVGVVGHDDGGLVAPRLAPEASFVVLLAAPAVAGTRLLALQNERIAQATGLDSTAAAAFGRATGAMLEPLAAAPAAPDSVLQVQMEAALNRGLADVPTSARMRMGLAGGGYAARRRQIVADLLAPGTRSRVLADPASALASLSVPTLALYGSLDTQVPADKNAPPMQAALAGRAGSEVVVLDGKNHLFQTATTGAPTEYGQIEETLAPDVLSAISAWILRTAGR